MVDRWTALRQFPVPSLETVTLLTGVRLMLGAMVVVTTVWLVRRIASRSDNTDDEVEHGIPGRWSS
jgi:hypothetical protein